MTSASQKTSISTWRDLKVWQKAHQLVLLTYRVTAYFPESEKFGLISQMRRAAISTASNIVEGFHRSTIKDSLNFYNKSASSLEELRYQYFVSCELSFTSQQDWKEAERLCGEVSKMLFSWSKSQRKNG